MTDRVINCYPGPRTLPLPVLERVHSELFNFSDTGMTIMEISHRSPEIQTIIDDTTEPISNVSLITIPHPVFRFILCGLFCGGLKKILVGYSN